MIEMPGDADVPREFSGFDNDKQAPVKGRAQKKKIRKERKVEKGGHTCPKYVSVSRAQEMLGKVMGGG